jgi:putative endonuclease
MVTIKRKLGDLGEEIAEKYLRENNYQILKKNYQKRWGEIDIVAKENQEIVFIEVKTRTKDKSDFYGEPQESVNFFKQQKLVKTAKTYLYEKDYSSQIDWRIDVIAIKLDEQNKKANLNHIKNAVIL